MKLRSRVTAIAAAGLLGLIAAGLAGCGGSSSTTAATATAKAARPAPTIRSAGRAYLRLVSPNNKRIDELNRQAKKLANTDLAGWKDLYRSWYLVEHSYIGGLSQIRWPHQMRPIVNSLIRASAAEAEMRRTIARASSFEEMNGYWTEEGRLTRAQNVAVSVLRANLRLPQVP